MYSVVGADGQVYGPADMLTLELWVREGRITPSTQMIDPVDGRTYQAQDLLLLTPIFESVASAQVQPPSPPPKSVEIPTAQTPFRAGNEMISPYPRVGLAPIGQRSKVAAILLALFLGGLGIHRFYLGYTAIGVVILLLSVASFLTCGLTSIIVFIWCIVDAVMIATGSLPDADGYRLS